MENETGWIDDVVKAAEVAAGNWRKWDSYVWHTEPDDGDKWAQWVIRHRDADCLMESNAAAIREALEPFATDHTADGWENYSGPDGDDGDPDVSIEEASHWAVGWVESVCIRVYGADGGVTAAFRAAHDLAKRLYNYPVLDEEDYSRREWDEGVAWCEQAGPMVFGRAWGVFVDTDDVMTIAFDLGHVMTGDDWGRRPWDQASRVMGVDFVDGAERWV